MSPIRKFKSWINFCRHDDAYAKTREQLWCSVQESLNRQIESGKVVWLVVHFPDTFEHVQDLLGRWQINYRVASQSLKLAALQTKGMLEAGEVWLVLSDLICEIDQGVPNTPNQRLAVFVLERHPLIDHDQRVQAYCKQIGLQLELGYFLAFEDRVVQAGLDKMTLLLMEQMGLSDHSLINSMTLTRRINKRLLQLRVQYQTDIGADNEDQWFELNEPAST